MLIASHASLQVHAPRHVSAPLPPLHLSLASPLPRLEAEEVGHGLSSWDEDRALEAHHHDLRYALGDLPSLDEPHHCAKEPLGPTTTVHAM